MSHEPYPLNVPGPFYVCNDLCILCGAPEHAAPDLIAFDDPDGRTARMHCFFRKQPEVPKEMDRAVEALRVSCCGALRYGGRDAEVLARLRALGLEDVLDFPGG